MSVALHVTPAHSTVACTTIGVYRLIDAQHNTPVQLYIL